MSPLLRFPEFEIDTALRALRVRGKSVELGGRAFDLLVVMAERHGHVVAKNELLDLVWGDKPVGDFNLHVHISTIRRHLGHEVIRTVPGRGYCFAAAPSQPQAAPVAPVSSAEHRVQLPEPVGRSADLAEIQALLRQERAVVITGPGGIGKTLLARIVLSREERMCSEGAAHVDLTTMNVKAGSVAESTASALRLRIEGSDPLASFVAAARALQATVLLDNADEFAVEVGTMVARVLDHCPQLRLLVTSQVPLRVPGLRHYALGPLAVPPSATPLNEALGFSALTLLDQRLTAAARHARLQVDDLDDAIHICRRLDGLPLAIELIAPRCAQIGLSGVRAELGQPLRFLSSPDRPAATQRHSSLQALMAWSYGLLGEPQQRAFRCIAVCNGGFGLELGQLMLEPSGGAEDGLSGTDLLADLVDHGLVSAERASDRQMHYRQLESARHYALQCLVRTAEEAQARGAHARAVTTLFESAYREFWDLTEPEFVCRYEPELDNLRAALDWLHLRQAGDLLVQLAGASAPLWRCLSLHHEGIQRLRQAAQACKLDRDPHRTARLQLGISMLYGESASIEGREPARDAAARYALLGDRRGRYLALAHLAYSYRCASDPEAAKAWQALQRLEDPQWPASVRLFGARAKPEAGAPERRIREGQAINRVRLALATSCGSDYEANCALVNLADLALADGEPVAAVRLNRELLRRLTRRHQASRVIALGNLLGALVLAGELSEAQDTIQMLLEAARSLTFMFGMFATDAMALMCALQGRISVAGHLLGYADNNYGARHRERGPNEQALRDRAWQLLMGQTTASERNAWMKRGARLGAETVCLLAMGIAPN